MITAGSVPALWSRWTVPWRKKKPSPGWSTIEAPGSTAAGGAGVPPLPVAGCRWVGTSAASHGEDDEQRIQGDERDGHDRPHTKVQSSDGRRLHPPIEQQSGGYGHDRGDQKVNQDHNVDLVDQGQ